MPKDAKTFNSKKVTKKRNRLARRPTIRDVSRLAGVSNMTVSRVLSSPGVVSPDTREKVEKAIADLGYVPDRAAGGLSSSRTGFIGLLLPTLTNANFSTVAHGLTEVLKSRDYQLLIGYTDYDSAEEERQLANLLARRPEAIVLTGATHSRNAGKLLTTADVPVIEIADLPIQPVQYAVGFSNYEVGRTAARYLIEHGFKKIGAIASRIQGTVGDYRGEERIRGFEDELHYSGLSTAWVLRDGEAPVSFHHGARTIGKLLDKMPGLEAVFAVSDLSAVGAMLECQRRGVPVPEHLSIMGFGDFEIAREFTPPLSTIHVDFHALGHRVGRLIFDLLLHDGTGEKIDVGLKLIERGSVRRSKK